MNTPTRAAAAGVSSKASAHKYDFLGSYPVDFETSTRPEHVENKSLYTRNVGDVTSNIFLFMDISDV